MNFGLLVPAFLAGLVALAVPIVLHLRHRDRDRPQRFPSLMFLEQLPIRTAERRRITDWPLLLLRAFALALLVLAFARPVFSHSAALERSKRSRAVVILLDRSLSMGRTGVWPIALDSARRIISSLGAEDRVAVVAFDDQAEVVQPFTHDYAAALAALGKVVPSPRGTRYAAALRATRQLVLTAGNATAEAAIITDLQRSGVGGMAGLDLPKGLDVRTIGVGTTDVANSAVTSVDVRRIAEPTRTLLAVQARILARELPMVRRAHVTLTLNGRATAVRDVNLPSSGDVPVAFDPVLLPAGRVRGAISIDHDVLAADDSFHFAFTADDAVHVLLVLPDDAAPDETMFLERALAVGRSPAIRVDRARARTLDARTLARAELVVLWDVPPPANSGMLVDWVTRGGGLVIVAGRRFTSNVSTSSLLPARSRGNADRLTDRGGTLDNVRLDHPLFSAFRDASSSLSGARFLSYPRLEPIAGTEIIARFDDGLPAVLERRTGTGRVVMVDTPLDTRAGDFPLQPAYLPFVQRLVLYTSGRDATRIWRSTGQSWLLPESVREPGVLSPAGEIIRPRRDSGGATVALRESGIYALYEGRVQGEPVGLLAVNAPAAESDLTPIDPRELLLGVRVSDSLSSVSNEVPAPTEVESRQRIWRILLVLVAILLVIESFIANRGWRGTASRLVVSPPDGSAS